MNEGLKSTVAFLIYTVGMIGTYLYASYHHSGLYTSFATWFTTGFGIYITKRLIQRHLKFNGTIKKDGD